MFSGIGFWIFLICIMWAVAICCKQVQDKKLLKEDPEAWKAMKEQEAIAKEKKAKLAGEAAGGALNLIAALLKK